MRDLHEPILLSDVLDHMREHRKRAGDFGYLLGVNTDPKTMKSNKKGQYLTAIMYLQPGVNMCRWASPGCLAGCLNKAGNPVYAKGKERARKARTALFRQDPVAFLARLVKELEAFRKKCARLGVKPAVRLNGTSDIPWERVAPWLFDDLFSDFRFYDYTKGFDRLGKTPANYWLTFSRSEGNDFEVGCALARGHHVAVVIAGKKHRPVDRWNSFATEDGDADDLLFLRDNPVQVLVPKGPARRDTSGFVVHQLA
jgi:hypothetical protein